MVAAKAFYFVLIVTNDKRGGAFHSTEQFSHSLPCFLQRGKQLLRLSVPAVFHIDMIGKL